MNEIDQAAHDKDSEQFIRSLELEVFEAFMSRALSIVHKEDSNTSVADACRLADVALKAARGDGAIPATSAADDGLKNLLDELHTAYGDLRGAQAAGETKSGDDKP